MHGKHGTRIDYIMCWKHHSDYTARQCIYLDEFPLLEISGCRHRPLMTTIQRTWITRPSTQDHVWGKKARLALRQQWLQGHIDSDSFNEQVSARLHAGTDWSSPLDSMHKAMNTLSATLHHRKPQNTAHPIAGPCAVFQHHTRYLRQQHDTSLHTVFHSWFHVVHRDRARKLMNITAKNTRKSKQSQIMLQALQAANAKDHFRLYEAIRALAPKQTYKPVTIRSQTGALLAPAQAADHLVEWYTQLYQDEHTDLGCNSFSWPFSQEDLAHGLADLVGGKALAPQYAPATAWKMSSTVIADFLQPHLERWSQDAAFPPAWSGGTLTFLPKPGKSGAHASELRPIALLEPSGKVTMGILAKAIIHQAWRRLSALPQFAYLPGRGCSSAIHRLTQHCNQVRHFANVYKYPLHRQDADGPRPPLSGGITVSVDLSKAFDMVDRRKLFQSFFTT